MRTILHFLLLLLVQAPLLLAADTAKVEIDGLIEFVGGSDVRFIRSGTEYSGSEAADHLRMKLRKAGDRVKTTEDFITGIATKSYFTGELYHVRSPDGQTQPSGQWLQEQLRHMRTAGG